MGMKRQRSTQIDHEIALARLYSHLDLRLTSLNSTQFFAAGFYLDPISRC